MKSRFYTAQEVAEMLGVHQSTAYKIIKRLNVLVMKDQHDTHLQEQKGLIFFVLVEV